jgi:peroxidase
MHLIWARQHNRLADALLALHPSWDDETLYQEARRVLGAQMQHITYAEFLPSVLGRRF